MSGLPGWLNIKESTYGAEDVGLIPGWERSPGGGPSNLLQYFCWKNPIDSGAWQAMVDMGLQKSRHD